MIYSDWNCYKQRHENNEKSWHVDMTRSNLLKHKRGKRAPKNCPPLILPTKTGSILARSEHPSNQELGSTWSDVLQFVENIFYYFLNKLSIIPGKFKKQQCKNSDRGYIY